MNVFERAMQMEQEGIAFYEAEAGRTTHPGFKNILRLLINEEKKHYSFFDLLQRGLPPEELPPFPVDAAQDVFQRMRQNHEGFDFSAEQVEVYKKALEIERESERFYRAAAEQSADATLKRQILRIADEEKTHVLFVDGLVEYLNRPKEWVEHAMFSQLREY